MISPVEHSWPAADVSAMANASAVGNGMNGTSSGAAVVIGSSGRMLKARSTAQGTVGTSSGYSGDGELLIELIDEGSAWNMMWLLLALGELLLMCYFAKVAFTPFHKVHLLLVSVGEIFYADVSVFVLVYTWMSLTFLSVLYTVYPRSGNDQLELFAEMNGMASAAVAIFQLSLIGEPMQIDQQFLSRLDVWTLMGGMQAFNIFVFVGLYVLYIVLSLVLLLNLLIALLTYTFERIQESSLLISRLIFAQNVMHLELIAHSLSMDTRCGKRIADGRYVYEFRSVERRQLYGEDAGDGYAGDLHGGSNPFEEPLPTPMGRVERTLAQVHSQLAELAHEVASLKGSAVQPGSGN